MRNFEEIPQIKAYFASDRYKKYPVNGVLAVWKGTPTDSPCCL